MCIRDRTNLGCEGSPKLTFADIRTEEKVVSSAPPTETPQPSAAAKAVSDFLGELDEAAGAATNI